jgi:hypothetical protein
VATLTVAVRPADNQPKETFPPIFFSTAQLRVLSDMCGIFGADSSRLTTSHCGRFMRVRASGLIAR